MRAKFKKSLLGYSKKQVDGFVSSLNTEELEGRLKQLVDDNVKLSVELKVAKSGYADAAELLGETRMRVRELEEQLAAERYKLKQTEGKFNQIIENMKREQEEYLRSLQLDISKPRANYEPEPDGYSHPHEDEQAKPSELELFPGMGDDSESPLKDMKRSRRHRHKEPAQPSHSAQEISQPLKRSKRRPPDEGQPQHEHDDENEHRNAVTDPPIEMLDDVINSLRELQQTKEDDSYRAERGEDNEYTASINEANGDDFEDIYYTPPVGMEHLLDNSPRGGARGVMNRIYKMRSANAPDEQGTGYEGQQSYTPREQHTQAEAPIYEEQLGADQWLHDEPQHQPDYRHEQQVEPEYRQQPQLEEYEYVEQQRDYRPEPQPQTEYAREQQYRQEAPEHSYEPRAANRRESQGYMYEQQQVDYRQESQNAGYAYEQPRQPEYPYEPQRDYRPETQQADYTTYEHEQPTYGYEQQTEYSHERQRKWQEPQPQQQPYAPQRNEEPAYQQDYGYKYTYPQEDVQHVRPGYQPEQPYAQQPRQTGQQEWQQPAYQQGYPGGQPMQNESMDYGRAPQPTRNLPPKPKPLSYGNRRSRSIAQPVLPRNIKR